jgi:hypothetical protein
MLDPTAVVVGTAAGPGIWLAPEKTAPPAALGAFVAPWVSLGYASDDGVTVGGDTTTQDITPWQSKTPIRTLVTARTRTLHFILWELNETTLGLYFDMVIPPPALGVIAADIRSDSPQLIHAVAVDVVDGDNHFRLTYPRASLSTTGDMAITKSAVIPLDVTLSALDDAGVLAHLEFDNGSGSLTTATIRSDAA